MRNTNILKNNKKNKGFTIIETLVAITILMISIAGPLVIAQKGLMAAIYAKDQVTASFLAQDAMEYIKNIRDNDVLIGGISNWLSNLTQCLYPIKCNIDTINGSLFSDSKLYISNNGGYTHSGGTPSQFSRSFYITPRGNLNNEAVVTVTVSWDNGTIHNVLNLESEIFNIQRY